ncbi:ABC transporter substrate-binding protein [Azospirillum sp. SYSU D00513]|uniref:ABC transporter substrate-binding protein n=1 Tax=Azospirillum sp. SYSU D00513 TaxID=2812561 RepID=UPI002000167A|nr:ABC transporter substrate-binding protein [Azospirillum sp. SYSU D00513]
MMRKVFARGSGWLGATVLGAVLLVQPAAAQSDNPARVLNVVAPWEVASLDPAQHGHAFLRLEVAQTLLEVDGAGRPLPSLAASWTVSDDRLSWRFVPREGVVFHDGTPLTAEAVAASLRHARAKAGVLKEAPIRSIKAEGGAVLLKLTEPFAPIGAVLAHSSAIILAPASYREDGTVTAVIGTGPYRVERLEPPQKLVTTRSDRYWGPAPAVEAVSYLAAGRGETRALMAESGDADLVFTLDPASLRRMRSSRAVQVQSIPLPRTVAIKVNAGHPFLKDEPARRALSLAIDRAGIAAALLRAPEAAAGQLFPPSLPDWHHPGLAPLVQDRAKAEALLADLGWSRGEDGILRRDGVPFRLSLRTFPDRPELPLLAAALQDQLRAVGIALDVAIGNSSEIPAGHRDGTLELGLMARGFALIPDPLGTLVQDYGVQDYGVRDGRQGGDWGAMNWNEPRMAEALAELLRNPDQARGAELRRTVAALLQDELPVIPVAWYQQTAAVSRQLRNVSLDPFERSYRISAMGWAE